MKTNARRPFSFRRGSALVTVLMLTGAFAVITASMIRYSISERRGNERNRLILRAKNAAENICIYGAEQITTKLYRLRSTSPMAFIGGTNQVELPPANVLQAANGGYTAGATTMELYAGLTSSTGLQFIDPAVSPNDPNAGLQVNTANVPVISKATGFHAALGTITSYARQDLAVDFVPLFQFGVFYNMDLEIWPGANMTLAGPVHANGEINARSAPGFTATIAFLDRVSTSKGFYADANKQGDSIQSAGTIMSGAGGDAPVTLRHTTTQATTAIKSSSNVWRDHKYGQATENATSQANFKTFATTYYSVNLRTSVHGVTDLVLPAVTGYAKADNPATPDDERNNGRQIIDRPRATDTGAIAEVKISRRAGLYIVANPDDEIRTGYLADGSAITMLPQTYRCFLNTVNSNLSHSITEVILPGQPAYGYNDNGTPGNTADDWMYVNNFPNRYTTSTAVGHNQVYRMIQPAYAKVRRYNGVAWIATDAASLPNGAGYATGATSLSNFPDAIFCDMRRATNNSGLAALGASGSFRSGNPYTPQPIVKMDFDLTRFRMCVERTMSGSTGSYIASDTASTIYDVSMPTATNWASSIFNSGGVPAAKNLGLGAGFSTFPTATTLLAQDPYRMYFAPANPTAAAVITQVTTDPTSYAIGASDLVSNASNAKPWYDGITVYVQSVDAEVRALTAGSPQRTYSGVRLINGRGPVISLDGATYPDKTGFTFCTNDAAYIIGHFNADGNIDPTDTDTGTGAPGYYGGYSARYPDSANEKLCAVMADAITILSQPVYTNSTTPYSQTSGWSDSLSTHRTGTTWISNWATSQPSGSNGSDGIDDDFIPAAMPWSGSTTAGTAGASRDTKFGATTTEISSALLVGIVPTNHDPTGLTDGPPSSGPNGQVSGGLHNFPRLLEVWGSAGLYIRGSMVAMFESRVAMEPWSQRVYSAPARTWGLHYNLSSAAHDVPLEPVLLGARRLGFKEITPTEFANYKATIEALPH